MSIKARTLSSGRTVYDVRLRDPEGRAYKRTFRTKRDAEAFEAAQRTDRVRGAWIDPRKSATTFAELAPRWLSGNPAKRPTSLERDEAIIRLHLLPELGPRAVGSITPADVQRVVNGWVQRYAPRTVHRHYDVLSAIMTTAVLEDLVARTPCRGIKLPAVRHTDRHIVTAEELGALAEALGPDYGSTPRQPATPTAQPQLGSGPASSSPRVRLAGLRRVILRAERSRPPRRWRVVVATAGMRRGSMPPGSHTPWRAKPSGQVDDLAVLPDRSLERTCASSHLR